MDIMQSRIEYLDELIKASRGDIPIDLLIKDVNILNVLTGEILKGDIGVHKGFIVNTVDLKSHAILEIDGNGKTAIPSFIDPHVHIESSMVLPNIYSSIVAPQGTGTIYTDPHEIVNVMGINGLKLMMENAKNLPVRFYFDASSCVPSKRGVVSSSTEITSKEVEEMFQMGVKKIGELMATDEIVSGDITYIDIIKKGWNNDIARDAHFPLLDMTRVLEASSILPKLGFFMGMIISMLTKGRLLSGFASKFLLKRMRKIDHTDLDAYLTALGPTVDHENIGPELRIKLDHGLRIMLKTHYKELLGLMVKSVKKLRYKDTVGVCSDDIWPDELVQHGGILGVLKELIDYGLDPIDAIRFATYNNAQHLASRGVKDARFIGLISPGMVADINLIAGRLKKLNIDTVIHNGEVIVENGTLINRVPESLVPRSVFQSVKLGPINETMFKIKEPQSYGKEIILTRVINLPAPPALPIPTLIQEEIPIKNGFLDTQGYTLIDVFNRYGKYDDKPSQGIIKGFSMKSGAIASTVAHDEHNLIVLGKNTTDMAIAAKKAVEMDGGIVAVKNSEVIGSISLPVGGLISMEPIQNLVSQVKAFKTAAKNLKLDSKNPLLPLVIFSLPAVPGPKVTDLGLWDDVKKMFVPLFVL